MVKVDDDNEAIARLEAALYSAGRPLKIEELIRASGTESRTKTVQLCLAGNDQRRVHCSAHRRHCATS